MEPGPILNEPKAKLNATHAAEQRESSTDSAPLWAALGDLPRPAPTLALFDEHESSSFEDGEFDEVEDQGPPPNQAANYVGNSEDAHDRYMSLDEITSKHRPSLPFHDHEPTARKRSWTGSAASDEERRAARRQRVTGQVLPQQNALPPIRELMRNPWRGTSEAREVSYAFPSPVSRPATSRLLYKRNESPFYHDEHANVSGHAPTLRGSSIDSTPEASATGEPANRASVVSRASSRQESVAMEMDEEEGELKRSSLLQPPGTRRRVQEAAHSKSGGSNARSLRELLSDPDALSGTEREQERRERWRGGYRPLERGTVGTRTERWRDELEELRRVERDEDEDMDRRSHFSALPNTKAWEHSHGKGGVQETYVNAGNARTPGRRTSFQDPAGHGHETSRSEDGGRYSHISQAGRSRYSMIEEDEDVRTRGDAKENGQDLEWWQENRTSRMPSALAKEDEVEDVPAVVTSPHSDRWTIHQSNPEEHFTGLSKEWMRAVWKDEKPIVLFTVFNYRFTKNQEVNRHIDTNVTAITTYLTGEKDFHVVPPDPEWRHDIRARDLPYLWVIRGLSEAAAWEMIKLHVISDRGVSIITHPKSLENPRFVCGLAGFLRPDVKATKEAVLDILGSKGMLMKLAAMVRSNERLGHLSIERRVEKIVESLDIRFMATKEDGDVANVYILPPSDDMDEWREWADVMRGCRFNVFINGTGTARKAFYCGGCRGVDHEDQECPIPLMKGWKGPQAGDRWHSKYWEPEHANGRRPERGRGHSQRGSAPRAPTTATKFLTANGRGARGGSMGPVRGRGRGQTRGYGARAEHEQYGGMRGAGTARSPSFQEAWTARF
ncbi:hypothetical protein K466DRAFT_606223 [Polyporus arcularius HHB13444]|uniref:Uncharacterized protein n=1 Tax=Polyporus arcularius HHB13444 TaxID=1314778 RepID=A0A5C3NQL0_9APHY|nr:hypothetical protein K466DRAFT_606223 [Polyporus arcularius HHB13444]